MYLLLTSLEAAMDVAEWVCISAASAAPSILCIDRIKHYTIIIL